MHATGQRFSGFQFGTTLQFRIAQICCVLLLCAPCLADERSNNTNDASELESAKQLLRQASELAAEQDESQDFWTMRSLLQIGEIQMRARDFEGAKTSIQASTYSYGRKAGLVKLAEALAGAGKREQSLGVLRELGSDHGWRQELLNDGVRLRWIDHLIESSDLETAQDAAEQIESDRYRSDGFRKLGVGYARIGEQAKSAQNFKLAVDSAFDLKNHGRAKALWETGEAQLSVGAVEAARSTIGKLVEAADEMDLWAKVAAYREAAVLSAKLSDRRAAESLFQSAIKSHEGVDRLNKIGALQWIAIAQARVGYIDDALKTAEMIAHSESEFSHAVLAVSKSQLAANDPGGAERTALSITHFLQYRDDSLHAIIEYHIENGDYEQAMAVAKKVHNPSRRASAVLIVATAYAKAGDLKTAEKVASRIELIGKSFFAASSGIAGFDYQRPDTWGVNYDIGNGFTMMSYHISEERTAEVAASAMTLAQTIQLEPEPNYADLLNNINSEPVTRALARAHASAGDASKALAWAQRCGSDTKITSTEDYEASSALKRRIFALIGVAEGILDRLDGDKPNPIP